MAVIDLLQSFLFSFLLTLGLEYPVLLLFGIRDRKDLLLALPVNLLTNPAVVALFYLLRPLLPAPPLQLALETAVILFFIVSLHSFIIIKCSGREYKPDHIICRISPAP